VERRAAREPSSNVTDVALTTTRLERDFRSGFWLRRRRVLGPLDLAVARGGALGLLGPNGSGKSTLLRLCAGVDEPSRGAVRVLGLDPRTGAGRAATGLLADGFPYPGELSGRAVLDLVARLRGVGATRAARRHAIEHWLGRVGLAPHAGRAVARWSTGMRRRLALACAAIHEPALLLLDEPGAGLDAEGFAVLDEVLLEAHARGATLVLCSHHGSELFRHAQDLCVLVAGRAAFRGSRDELAARARRLELEVELAPHGNAAGLAHAVASSGAHLVAARPAAAATAALYAELARALASAPQEPA